MTCKKVSPFISHRFGKQAGCLTKRAPDAGDSGAIPSIFLRLKIFPVGRRSAARPSAVTQTVRRLSSSIVRNLQMIIETEKKVNWLNIASIFWGVVGILSIIPAGCVITVILVFNAPSPNSNANYFFVYSVISFPIACIGSSIGIRFLKNNYNKLVFIFFLLPVIPLILIYVGSNWISESNSIMRNEGNATPVGKCTLPVLDGGDGLETTGCGLLEDDMPVTGITYTTSEAHNWQFSYQFTPPYKTGGGLASPSSTMANRVRKSVFSIPAAELLKGP